MKNKVSFLCELTGISRSGYYNFFSASSQKARQMKNKQDEIDRDVILKAYAFKNRKKGAQQIKMTLHNEYSIVYNLKRIRRIMNKYGITCPIRKAKPYKRMMKATMEHSIVPNKLERNFKQGIPGKVLLTDITYLYYEKGQKAYLSTIKDGSTNEILAFNISTSLSIDIALDTIKKLKKNKQVPLHKDAFIHSDQGFHYTNPAFQNLLKSNELGQSMSRRGNCWDNAPQESFFGHFKDEANIKTCSTIDALKKEVKNYIDYYNNHRCQWDLEKMTPVQYRDHILKTV